MIQAKNLSRLYTTDELEMTALNNINLHIRGGEFMGILGAFGLWEIHAPEYHGAAR